MPSDLPFGNKMYYNDKKNYSKKYKKINPWIFSVGVSLIMYTLLYFLFATTAIKVNKSAEDKPQIIMLPLSNSEVNSKQKQLLYWLKDDNPTLIVKPNAVYGYSSILKPDYKFAYSDAVPNIGTVLNSDEITFHSSKTLDFDIKTYTPMQLLSKLDLINMPGLPPYPFQLPKTDKPSYPYIQSYYTGESIPVKFNNITKVHELTTKYNPQTPTVLRVTVPSNSQFFPIVNIVSSCGSTVLDNIAVKALTMTDMENFSFSKRNNITTKVYVKWH